MMILEDILINKERKDYKCYDFLRELINNNSEFREIIYEGILMGNINRIPDEVWKKIELTNCYASSSTSFEEYLANGWNYGDCVNSSLQIYIALSLDYICGGIVHYLIGTNNSPDGSHTWCKHRGKIYDMTFMLVIDSKFAEERLGYSEKNCREYSSIPLFNAIENRLTDLSFRDKADVKKKIKNTR